MDSLYALVKAGKVLYLGSSNMPAWFVAGCNSYAKHVVSRKFTGLLRSLTGGKAKGQATFVVLQTRWNVLE
jgi:aryl-alcohol dehydrogenase-like predicted oxidoreductase